VRAQRRVGGDIGLGEPAARRERGVDCGRQVTPSVCGGEPLHLVEALVEQIQLNRFAQRGWRNAQAQLLELSFHRVEGVAGKG
jgi:hypothetical protein